MSDDSRIKNNQAPYQEYKTEQNDDVDPEKFKKILKVDKSEDSQKKRKRALKEEEDNDEDEVDGTGTAPQEGLFASFMNDEKSSSVFDKQSAGVKNIEVSEGGPTTELTDDEPTLNTSSAPEQAPPPNINTSDLDQSAPSSNPADMGDEMDFSGLEPMDEINYNPEPPASNDSTSSDRQQEPNKTEDSKPSKTSQADQAQPKVRITKKKGVKKSVKGSEPEVPKKKVIKKTASQKAEPVKDKALEKDETKEAKPVSETGASEKAPTKETASPHFTPATPEKVADSLLASHESSDHDREGHEGNSKHKKEKLPSDKIVPLFPHASAENAGIAIPTDIETAPPAPVHSPVAAMTKLSPEVYELFEKMAGVITIESGHDMTTTSVVVNMEGSVFHGAEVVLNQYKSAQGSYNLELKGSPAAVDLFTENLPMLEASFKQGNFDFEVNILPPSLSKKSGSKRVKRKSHDSKKDKR